MPNLYERRIAVKTLMTTGLTTRILGIIFAYTGGSSEVDGWHRKVKNVYFMRFFDWQKRFDKTVVGKQYLSNGVGVDNNY